MHCAAHTRELSPVYSHVKQVYCGLAGNSKRGMASFGKPKQWLGNTKTCCNAENEDIVFGEHLPM